MMNRKGKLGSHLGTETHCLDRHRETDPLHLCLRTASTAANQKYTFERAAPTAADPKETLPSASVKVCFGNNSEVNSGSLFGSSFVPKALLNPFRGEAVPLCSLKQLASVRRGRLQARKIAWPDRRDQDASFCSKYAQEWHPSCGPTPDWWLPAPPPCTAF